MRPLTRLLSFSDALALVKGDAAPIDRVETVPLADADGRVAAASVEAGGDVPPFHRAAMDGYAVLAADTFGASEEAPRELTCVGTVEMGLGATLRIGRGQCAAISTGAPMPDGADAVVMVEHTTRDGSRVRIGRGVIPGQHVGLRGADLASGDPVVRAGDLLGPARLGAIGAAGLTHVQVYARPEVALVSTGDELVEAGTPLGPGQIHEINRLTLGTIVRRHGGVPRPLPIARDTTASLDAAVEAAASSDVIVFSGGSSAGERDLVRDVLARDAGLRFHGIAVKPGKPTAFGRVAGRPAFGLPGNPTSCLSNGYLLLLPFLRKMARLPDWEPRRVRAPLARPLRSTSDRHQFFTVRLARGLVEPAFKGSGEITSMANADGYIEIPVGMGELERGAEVEVVLF